MPQSYCLARIHLLSDGDAFPSDVSPLKIDEGDIRIFRDTLLAQMRLLKNAQGWWLEFFPQGRWVQRFFVDFVFLQNPADKLADTMVLHKKYWRPVAKLAYAELSPDQAAVEAEDLAAACADTSRMTRNSAAVRVEDLYEALTHYGYVNGRGTQYISKLTGRLPLFERHVLLHALAHAYLLTQEKLSEALAEHLAGERSEAALRTLYMDVAMFNATSFFRQPVKRRNAPTCQAWSRIDQALGIHESHAELFKQVETAHYIYGLDEEKRTRQQAEAQARKEKEAARRKAEQDAWRERREKRRDLALTVIGLLLALASAPGAIEAVQDWWF